MTVACRWPHLRCYWDLFNDHPAYGIGESLEVGYASDAEIIASLLSATFLIRRNPDRQAIPTLRRSAGKACPYLTRPAAPPQARRALETQVMKKVGLSPAPRSDESMSGLPVVPKGRAWRKSNPKAQKP